MPLHKTHIIISKEAIPENKNHPVFFKNSLYNEKAPTIEKLEQLNVQMI
ncbi:MAG TPA: hypothetical protein VJ824_14005 [Bacillota bacterium]|nr:hypothetical protein [Bacillota bacterium]